MGGSHLHDWIYAPAFRGRTCGYGIYGVLSSLPLMLKRMPSLPLHPLASLFKFSALFPCGPLINFHPGPPASDPSTWTNPKTVSYCKFGSSQLKHL
jgi:hypothetical protein